MSSQPNFKVEFRWLSAAEAEARRQEKAEARMRLLQLPPALAQEKANILCAELWAVELNLDNVALNPYPGGVSREQWEAEVRAEDAKLGFSSEMTEEHLRDSAEWLDYLDSY